MAITTLADTKSYLGITTTEYDTKIDLLIPVVEQIYLEVRNAPFDHDDQGNTVYPVGSAVVAAEMIGYKLSQDGSFRFETSERLGSYSVSYGSDQSSHGFPPEITGMIKRYVKVQ